MSGPAPGPPVLRSTGAAAGAPPWPGPGRARAGARCARDRLKPGARWPKDRLEAFRRSPNEGSPLRYLFGRSSRNTRFLQDALDHLGLSPGVRVCKVDCNGGRKREVLRRNGYLRRDGFDVFPEAVATVRSPRVRPHVRPAFPEAGVTHDPREHRVRLEWGLHGVETLAPISDVVVIVDVLCFSTAVDAALGAGAEVLPYRWKDDSAAEHARAHGALLATRREVPGGYSLSPESLAGLPPGARIVLPSPNGSTLSFESRSHGATLVGCLRNAPAVARAARRLGGTVAVVPAGERWEDGSLRVAVEDHLGAGAIVASLPADGRSPEAWASVAAFEQARPRLAAVLDGCASGIELRERGFPGDAAFAAAYGVSETVPRLEGVALRDASRRQAGRARR